MLDLTTENIRNSVKIDNLQMLSFSAVCKNIEMLYIPAVILIKSCLFCTDLITDYIVIGYSKKRTRVVRYSLQEATLTKIDCLKR